MQVTEAETGDKRSSGPAASVFRSTHKAKQGETGETSVRPGPPPVMVDDSSDDDEDEDLDDPIVLRMPVYFNSAPDLSLSPDAPPPMDLDDPSSSSNPRRPPSTKPSYGLGSLALLQYPHRPIAPSTNPHPLLPPSLRPWPPSSNSDAHARISARWKPGVRELNLEVPMEVKMGTKEERFSEDRAREFARGLPPSAKKNEDGGEGGRARGKGRRRKRVNRWDGSDEDDGSAGDGDDDAPEPLSKMRFSSTTVPEQTHYLVGIHRPPSTEEPDDPGTMHLVPLAQTIQLRPDLGYLDGLKALNRRGATGTVMAGGGAAEEGGEEAEGGGGGGGSEGEEDGEKPKGKKKAAGESRSVQQSVGSAGVNVRGGAISLFTPLRASEAEPWVDLAHFHCETSESAALREKLYCPDPTVTLEQTSSWKDLLKV